MPEHIHIPLEEGGYLTVEAADGVAVRRAGGADKVINFAVESLEKTLAPASQAARAALQSFKDADPHEVEIEFGVKLTGAAGVLIAKTGAEGHLHVKLKWSLKES